MSRRSRSLGKEVGAIDFDGLAAIYARYRSPSESVLRHILENVRLTPFSNVLEVGCGTATHLSFIQKQLSVRAFGLDKSFEMLRQAFLENPTLNLVQADVETGVPYVDNSFDFVFMVDVIHYIHGLNLLFKELFRVLRPDSSLLVATVSEEDLRNQTMAYYFPDTIAVELERHPSIARIVSHLKASGLRDVRVTHIVDAFKLTMDDLNIFRSKLFSALRLISDESFHTGIAKMEADVAKGEAAGKKLQTFVWGRK